MSPCTDAALRAAIAAGGTVTFGCSGTITFTNEIVVAVNTTLDGTGANVTLSGNATHRLFVVQPGVQFTMRGLTLADGRSTNGGAILNQGGTVTITSVMFSNNVAIGANGVDGPAGTNALEGTMEGDPDYNRGGDGGDGQPGSTAQGGAIWSSGPLRITNAIFVSNQVLGGTGGNGGAGGNGGTSLYPVTGRVGSGGKGAVGGDAFGGAIYATATAYLHDSTFSNQLCRAGSGGGGGNIGYALYASSTPVATPDVGAVGGSAGGGGVFSLGQIIVTNCSFLRNETLGGGGGAGGSAEPVVMPGVRAANGTNGAAGGIAYGAAVFSAGPALLLGSTFGNNRASGGDGGAGGVGESDYGLQGSAGGDAGVGGSAFGAGVTLSNDASAIECVFAGNRAEGGTGGFGGRGGYRSGSSGLGGKGGDGEGGAVCAGTAATTLILCVFSNNIATGGTGGTAPQTWSTAYNTSGRGGVASGGALANHAAITLQRVTIQSNRAEGGTGASADSGKYPYFAIRSANGALGGDAFGAGVYNLGVLVVNQSLFTANVTVGGDGGMGGDGGFSLQSGGDGGQGGSGFGGAIFSAAGAAMTNSTFHRNVSAGGMGGNGGTPGRRWSFECYAVPGGSGGPAGSAWGGAMLLASGTHFLTHLTLAHNEVSIGDGGIGAAGVPACDGTPADGNNGSDGSVFGGGLHVGSGESTLKNVILAYNVPRNVSGSITDAGLNLTSDSSYAFGSGLNNIDPRLGGLGNFGGPTMTMPLLSGSPAIDKIAAENAPATDQRGVARPRGSAADIGAYEANADLFGIFGRVTASGSGLGGITVMASNAVAISDAQGFYRLGGFAPGSYVVMPRLAGGQFSPPSYTAILQTNVFDIDFALTNLFSRGEPIAGRNGSGWTFQTVPAVEFIVEASVTLTNWTSIVTNTASADGSVRFVDPNPAPLGYRFYRLRVR